MSTIASSWIGYDVVFLTEVPEDLTCVICSLVLKDPLQVMLCGHRYCSSCFEKMTKHASNSKADLLCPIDRHPVQMDKVFPDNAAARTIRNLKVKCKSHELGCEWSGCFGDINEHYSTCKYIPKCHSPDDDSSKHHMLYTELLQRVVKCERDLESKEKEMACLKFTVKELKDESSKDREEMKTLKGSIMFLLNEVHVLKQKNEENVHKYDGEAKSLHEKTKMMEKEVTNCVKEIQTIIETKLDCEKEEFITAKLEEHINRQIKTVEKKVETEFEGIRNEVGIVRNGINESLNKQGNEISKIEDMKILNNESKEIIDLQEQVHLVENALFLFNSVQNKNVQFKWILENFNYHCNDGKEILSPMFTSQVFGYRFKLVVEWKGQQKEKMGLFIKLCRGKDKNGLIQNLLPFGHKYSSEILNKNGGSCIKKITLELLQRPGNRNVSIPDGKDEAGGGLVYLNLFLLLLMITLLMTPCILHSPYI